MQWIHTSKYYLSLVSLGCVCHIGINNSRRLISANSGVSSNGTMFIPNLFKIRSAVLKSKHADRQRQTRPVLYAVISCRLEKERVRTEIPNCHGFLITVSGSSFCDICALFTEGLSAFMYEPR
jgi:hypothetical protein